MPDRNVLMTMPTEETPDALRSDFLRYGALPVTLIAEPVAGVRAHVALPVVLKRLSASLILPVLDQQRRLLGVISAQDVLLAPTESSMAATPSQAAGLATPPGATLSPTDTIAQAIARFGETDLPLIPLVDARGRYTGQCASRTQLSLLLHGLLKPARIGGLATPLGVYMTSGYYSSGAGWKGLIATGVLFGILAHALDWLGLLVYSAVTALFPIIAHWSEGQQMILQTGLVLVSLLALLRLSPISGLHAAEHMTINAIERDLDLTEPLIRTQPREHIRCGTNLMVFLGGLQILGISLYYAGREMNPVGLTLYTALWLFVIFKFWKPAGLWLQRHFTTKTPTSAQLASGIKAGEELLEKFRQKPHPMPSLARRIWGSGLVHMAVSFLITAWLLGLLLERWGLA
jgi:CBS domain-containing protein